MKTEEDTNYYRQLYLLDIEKELSPTLNISAGGIFTRKERDTETRGSLNDDNESLETTISPNIDLQLRTPEIKAVAGYRKNERKNSLSLSPTERTFTEEYSARLKWEPVELPQIDLDFTRNLAEDKPLTFDQQVDNFMLRSRYKYGDYNFFYSHSINDNLNRLNDDRTESIADRGSIHFSRNYAGGRVLVGSSLQGNRQETNFEGSADRRVPVANRGTLIGTRRDDIPETSDPDNDFSLADISLLVGLTDPLEQFSFGFEFTTPTDVDTLLVNFTDLGNYNSDDFSWSIYIRNNATENWTQVTPVQADTNFAENRFELTFPQVKTRFIKIVTRQIRVPGEELYISTLAAQITLPANTSKFISTDWTGDLFINWKLSDVTTLIANCLYSEQRYKPSNNRRTLSGAGISLSHSFNKMFVGSMQLQRADNWTRGEGTLTSHDFSMGLAAKYLDTFDQRLTYSFSHENDEESRNSFSNGLFLRSNLHLYDGWSLFLDNGLGWQESAEGESSNTAVLRIGSNIQPNRWLNLSLTYNIEWSRTENEPLRHQQDGHMVVNWVPTRALSLTADMTFTKDSEDDESIVNHRYFISWFPLRDGTLDFSLSYSQTREDEEKIKSLSPQLRWQLNRSTNLRLEYVIGKRENKTEKADFQNMTLNLQIFY